MQISNFRPRKVENAISPAVSTDRAFSILLALVVLGGISFIVLALDAVQQHGLLQLDYKFSISYSRRIPPLAVLSFLGFGFALLARVRGIAEQIAAVTEFLERNSRLVAWSLICGGVITTLIVVWALRAFPNSGDEYDYLFEAKTFLAGRLWNPAPPVPALFQHFWIAIANGKWFAAYPPGWPVVLSGAMALRLPIWLADPIIGAVLLYGTFRLGQKRDGALGAVLAVALVTLSPFFLFNAASYFDVVPATAAGVLFAWAALDFLERPRFANAVFSGLALGMAGLIRNQDALLFALPFAGQFLWQGRRRHYALAPAIILAGLPFLATLLLFNHAVLGSALPLNGDSTVRFGLYGVDNWGEHMTPFDELHFFTVRLVLLAEWNSPFLVIFYIPAFFSLIKKRRISFIDLIFPIYIMAFMLVPFTGGNQYGPRYYFEGFPFLALTLVSAYTPLVKTSTLDWKAFFTGLGMAHSVICVAGILLFALVGRVMVNQRMDVYDQVSARHLRDAVVVLRSPTSPMRMMQRHDLTRNGISADGPVLYVLDIPKKLERLHQLMPDRRFYVYERAPRALKGTLRPWSPAEGRAGQ